MALSVAKRYKVHVENLRAIDLAQDRIRRDLLSCLSRNDMVTADALLKTSLLLVGVWAECRLKKLLHEVAGFTDGERTSIYEKKSQIDQWQAALDLGFRKRYNVKKAKLSLSSLKASGYARYTLLSEILEKDLRPVIEMRNTLAHGQWARPLNSSETEIAANMIVAMKNENALSVTFKLSLIQSMSAIIHDLVSGGPAFERDFDQHFMLITNTKVGLTTRSYGAWAKQLAERRKRGDAKRHAATKTPPTIAP